MSFAPLAPDKMKGFAERLEVFARGYAVGTGDETLSARAGRFRLSPGAERDGVSTGLMEAYKQTGSQEAFALLYELNYEEFQRLVYHHLRRSYYPVDPADVLQEVFFNVYRYPFKFKPDRVTAFRNWTHSIIRNTVLKHSRKAQRNRTLSINGLGRDGEEGPALEPEDFRVETPLEITTARESNETLIGAWRIYLHFYLHAYRCLTPREKRALYLVEVDGLPYREAAAALDVRVENLKMMVFRARRKIFSIMKRKFLAAQSAADREQLREMRADVVTAPGGGA